MHVSGITVGYANLMAWKDGAYVQGGFPHLSVDDRELLVSGTHPGCFSRMFGEED